jgi:hypothetical protein
VSSSELAAAVEQALDASGLSMSEWTRRSGVSRPKLTALRRGEAPVTASLRRKAEAALGWAPRSIDRILDGGEPVLAGDTSAADVDVAFSADPGVIDRLREVPDRLDRLERMVEELLAAARPNPTEPPPGTVPARTDAQRAAKRKP